MFNNYDPMKFIKQMHDSKIYFQKESTNSNQQNKQKKQNQNKQMDSFVNFFEKNGIFEEVKNQLKNKKIIIVIIVSLLGIYLVHKWICIMPFERSLVFSDTPATISATYNNKYHIGKINISLEEIVEDWQVNMTNGQIEEIKLKCETKDKTVKKEIIIKKIGLKEGEPITGSITIDNMEVKDFVLIKDLLAGEIILSLPKTISTDRKDREEMQEYYESGAWLMGLFWADYLIRGY